MHAGHLHVREHGARVDRTRKSSHSYLSFAFAAAAKSGTGLIPCQETNAPDRRAVPMGRRRSQSSYGFGWSIN
jgi:hypothetical protein